MTYFVTGATGFIGRHLVEELLEREGDIHVLVRESSRARLDELVADWELSHPGGPSASSGSPATCSTSGSASTRAGSTRTRGRSPTSSTSPRSTT